MSITNAAQFVLFLMLGGATALFGQSSIILDTDMGSSTDDPFALELAIRLHKDGVVKLAAVMIDRPGEDNVAFTDAYLHHHGLDDIPIGTIDGKSEGQLIFVPYAELVHSNVLVRAAKRSGAVKDAVQLYREVMSILPDQSVELCAVGFFTNLMRLLDSPDGPDLIRRKVRKLRIMAGSFDGALGHPEYNVWGDVPSARRIFSSWPTPIVCTPYEVGVRIYYPAEQVRADFPANHPISVIYRQWDPDGPRSKSQLMWDPMTILGVADEIESTGFFTQSAEGEVVVDEQGITTFRPSMGGKTVIQKISLSSAMAVRRHLRALGSGKPRGLTGDRIPLRIQSVSSVPMANPEGEFIALTNLSATVPIELGGCRVVASQPEEGVAVDVRFPADMFLPPNGLMRLERATWWPSNAIPDKAVNILVYGADGDVIVEAYLDSRWYNGSCNGTGRYFECTSSRPLALEERQWIPRGKGRVIILHTNDTHAHIDDGGITFAQIAAEKARLKEMGENVILVDAGDFTQGTAYGGYDKGKSVIGIMNAVGYDVATPGNHEYDYGIPTMLTNMANCSFPVVSCNFLHRRKQDEKGVRVFPSYTVVTSGTTRVAFVGVTTPQSLTSANPSTFLDATGSWRTYDFHAGETGDELYASVQSAVNEAARQADYTVVLGHLGISQECARYMSTDVIAHTTNFVAFIDGHSHTLLLGKRVKNAAGKDVILTQTGCYLSTLGALTLDGGRCVAAGNVFPPKDCDPVVAAQEEKLTRAVENQLGMTVAMAPADICAYAPQTGRRLARSQDCAAGDFAADACWWYGNAVAGLECDVALMNGGNVRADLSAGKVTLKSLKLMQPFGTDIGVIEVQGRQLVDALEFGASVVGIGEHGGFLQVAGLTYRIDPDVPCSLRRDKSGNCVGVPEGGKYRVHDVRVYDRATGEYRPLELGRTYRVIGSSFTLVDAGDGFAMFKSGKVIMNALAPDTMVLSEYCKSFAKGKEGYPRLTSAGSPLAQLRNYSVAYENPAGSGRIEVVRH